MDVAPWRPVNTARFDFLDPRAEAAFRDWDRVATDTVRPPARRRWPRSPQPRPLRPRRRALNRQRGVPHPLGRAQRPLPPTGAKRFHHPVVGDLGLTFNRLDLAADPGLKLFTYTAEPGSPFEDALSLLGSWAATVDAESTRATDQG